MALLLDEVHGDPINPTGGMPFPYPDLHDVAIALFPAIHVEHRENSVSIRSDDTIRIPREVDGRYQKMLQQEQMLFGAQSGGLISFVWLLAQIPLEKSTILERFGNENGKQIQQAVNAFVKYTTEPSTTLFQESPLGYLAVGLGIMEDEKISEQKLIEDTSFLAQSSVKKLENVSTLPIWMFAAPEIIISALRDKELYLRDPSKYERLKKLRTEVTGIHPADGDYNKLQSLISPLLDHALLPDGGKIFNVTNEKHRRVMYFSQKPLSSFPKEGIPSDVLRAKLIVDDIETLFTLIEDVNRMKRHRSEVAQRREVLITSLKRLKFFGFHVDEALATLLKRREELAIIEQAYISTFTYKIQGNGDISQYLGRVKTDFSSIRTRSEFYRVFIQQEADGLLDSSVLTIKVRVRNRTVELQAHPLSTADFNMRATLFYAQNKPEKESF